VPDQLDPFDEFLEHAISELVALIPEEVNEVLRDAAEALVPQATPMRNRLPRDA
jgi:hypothetical protein